MKKSYKCEKLEHTIHFLPDKIKFCCSCAEGPGFSITDFSQINKKEIQNNKNKFINALKSGIIPQECSGCFDYFEIEEKNLIKDFISTFKTKKIKHIIIDHFKQCDCACVYCSQKILFPNVIQNYEILPLIEQMYKYNMFDEDLMVEFQGGNVSMLKEFDALMDKFNQNNCNHFHILTNGIKYLTKIEQIAQEKKCTICVSLDCGTKETFKKIKGIDAFEQTTNNIRKLTKLKKANPKLKYILIQGINDNKEEITAFLEFAKSLEKLDSIVFEIDYRDILFVKEGNNKVPNHYKDLFLYAENYCKENKIPFFVNEFIKSFLK